MPVHLPNAAATRLLDIIEPVRQISDGRGNAGGMVTLRANETTTTVTGTVISRDGVINLQPTTASASTVDWYIPTATQVKGQFVIQHDSNAAVDRTFRWSQTNA